MKTIFLLSILLSSLLFAKDVTPTTQSISAFVVPKDMMSIYASYNTLTKDIDLYHVKDQSNKNDYGYVGGLSGVDLSLRYGMYDHTSIFYNLSSQRLDYIGGDLTNIKNEIFARVNFYDVPHYIFDAFSVDIGFIRNASSDISIKNPSSIKNMFNTIRPSLNGITINDDKLYYNETLLSNQIDSKSGLRLNPTLRLTDLSDNSLFIRFVLGNRFSNALLNLYTGFKYSDIDTKISLHPKNSTNPSYANISSDFGNDDDLSRDEKTIMAGINVTLESENFIIEANYEHSEAFSRGLSGDNNHNNIFDINIANKTTDNLLIFLGAKAMLNQFNTIIPYLYNKYTDDSFHNKYSHLKLGFVYNFNMADFIYKNLEK
jgi:hypothetical protein